MLDRALKQKGDFGMKDLFPDINEYGWLHFKLFLKPMAKQGFKFTKEGNTYTPAEQREMQEEMSRQISLQLKQQKPDHDLFDCPLEARMIYAFTPPKSFGKRKYKKMQAGMKFYKSTKPDLWDNLNKIPADAMEGVVYVNDSRAVRVTLEKIYAVSDYIEIWIRKIPTT